MMPVIKEEPDPALYMYGKGCLRPTSKPGGGPFNGIFNAPDERCKYCTIR
jgi:hypothetical protein